jgi:hypothetical protein
MRNVEWKLFTHPLLYQIKENRRDVQTARAHTASVLATNLDSKKRRPLTVVTRVASIVRVADPSQLPPAPIQISMQPLELCVIRSNVSGTHTCLSLGTSHQVTSSARNGPVHAGIPYRNFFLFLNFMPALTNISSLFRSLTLLCLSIFFLVYLCLVFRMADIYMPVAECGYVPFFADVLSIYSCILLFFRLKGKCPTHFLYPSFLYDLI